MYILNVDRCYQITFWILFHLLLSVLIPFLSAVMNMHISASSRYNYSFLTCQSLRYKMILHCAFSLHFLHYLWAWTFFWPFTVVLLWTDFFFSQVFHPFFYCVFYPLIASMLNNLVQCGYSIFGRVLTKICHLSINFVYGIFAIWKILSSRVISLSFLYSLKFSFLTTKMCLSLWLRLSM